MWQRRVMLNLFRATAVLPVPGVVRTASTRSLDCASVGMLRRGSCPEERARRFSSAALRASARVTTGYEPSPVLTGLPLMRKRWLHVLDWPPYFIA